MQEINNPVIENIRKIMSGRKIWIINSDYSKFKKLLKYLDSLPAWRVPKAYQCCHADPQGNGKPEHSIEIIFCNNNCFDSSIPIGERFDRTTMKWLGTRNALREVIR